MGDLSAIDPNRDSPDEPRTGLDDRDFLDCPEANGRCGWLPALRTAQMALEGLTGGRRAANPVGDRGLADAGNAPRRSRLRQAPKGPRSLAVKINRTFLCRVCARIKALETITR